MKNKPENKKRIQKAHFMTAASVKQVFCYPREVFIIISLFWKKSKVRFLTFRFDRKKSNSVNFSFPKKNIRRKANEQ